jgi:hypothetical protein
LHEPREIRAPRLKQQRLLEIAACAMRRRTLSSRKSSIFAPEATSF